MVAHLTFAQQQDYRFALLIDNRMQL